MSVVMEFSIFPTDKGESLSADVSEVIRLIDESGLKYQLTPMGTVVETDDLASALALVGRSSELLESMGAKRVYGSIKFDVRKGKENRMEGKVAAVKARLQTVSLG